MNDDVDERFPLRVARNEFCRTFGASWDEVPEAARQILAESDLCYRRAKGKEEKEILESISIRLASGNMWVSGEEKQGVWERGWSENLQQFGSTGDIAALTPKFLAGKTVCRLEGGWILPRSARFEFDLVDVYRRWVFGRFLSGANELFEFGCGSCQHLPVLAQMFPSATIHGLDWAESSSRIVEALATRFGYRMKAHQFNLFAPDGTVGTGTDAGVLTIGTLEQLGGRFRPFLDYLLAGRPRVVVHLETVEELYDPSDQSDALALRYDRARNYLTGYLNALRELQAQGRLSIERAAHVRFGSMYHDSYSLLVWRPV